MNRVTSALVLGGFGLFTTWAVAPAGPTPDRPLVRAVDLKAFDQSAPVLAEVKTQVDRLRERLANPPDVPVPERDPFRFGRRPEPARPKAEKSVSPGLIEAPIVPAPVLPRLVAIMAETTTGGLVRSAALAIGDDVRIVKPGDSAGPYVVRSITSDAMELADPLSGATFLISIR